MKNAIKTYMILIALGAGITACNSGGSNGTSSDTTTASTTADSVTIPFETQTRTPTSAYIVATDSGTDANITLVNSTATSTAANNNSCFAIVTQSGANYSITKNSSQYYSTVAVNISLKNTCTTPATISGLNLNVNGFTINGSAATINYIAQTGNPYLTLTQKQTGSNLVLSLSGPACTGNYCSWAQVPAGAAYTFTVNAQIGTAISSAAVASVALDSGTPVTPTTGNLNLTVNTASLASSVCTINANCAIGINLLDPNGKIIQSMTVNPAKNPNITFPYLGLFTGNYTIAVNTSTYPSGSAGSISYVTNPSNSPIQINSATTTNASITFNYTAPVATGNLTIKTGTISEAATFANIGLLAGVATNQSTGVKTVFNLGLNSSVTLSGLASGVYSVALQGIGDAANNIYYNSTPVTVTVPSGNNTVTSNITFAKVTTATHKVAFTVSNAPTGQSVTFANTASFKYNTNSLISGSYTFLNSEATIAVTINPLSNYTVSYNPVVITPTVNTFNATFTAPVAPTNANPFTGAHQYVNPDYQNEVNSFLSKNPTYKTKAKPYLDSNSSWNTATSVWIDRMAAINGYTATDGTTIHGITWHMQQALNQATTATPTIITFVVYDLPNRDCAAYSSNGEINTTNATTAAATIALNQYKSNYIDPFNTAITQFYTNNPGSATKVKTVLLIEPDSLPNMITNAGINGSSTVPACKRVNDDRIYVQGVAYALNKFATNNNSSSIYMYLDIAHSGWLGWASNANQISQLFNNKSPTDTSTPYGGLGSGFDKIRGFVVNSANYTPTSEAFTYTQYLANTTIISSAFYQWNDAYSLDSYIAELMSIDNGSGKLNQINGHQIIQPTVALYKNMHFLLDTSRNGWATASYTANGVTYQRHDLRDTNANWCNIQNIILNGKQVSPGLGALPQANPILNNPLYNASNGTALPLPIDAYIWVKPPGESDGNFNSSTGTGDQMCSNGNGGSHNGSLPTDALQGPSGTPAPSAGGWFDGAFIQLLNNSINN